MSIYKRCSFYSPTDAYNGTVMVLKNVLARYGNVKIHFCTPRHKKMAYITTRFSACLYMCPCILLKAKQMD